MGLIGLILKKRYCVLEQIGQGGGGKLYLARDLELGTLWAVKEISKDCKKEAKLQLLLQHPSLPRMVDYVERESFVYLIMEYIPGKTLQQWLNEGRFFSLEEQWKIAEEIVDVLKYLHKRNPPVYYGDLKPDNLMLTDGGKLYLIDLGSAVLGYRSEQKICLGTKGFAAPEQYKGRVTAASDIYGFGKTMWAISGKEKWKQLFRSPAWFLFLVQCCRKDEKRRIADVEILEKKIKTFSGRGRGVSGRHFFLLVMLLILPLFLVSAVFLSGKEMKKDKRISLSQALTRVTQNYYDTSFWKKSLKEQKEVCKKTEWELQNLLKKYTKKEEQNRILLLLALNAEIAEQDIHVRQYYQQLLLFDPACTEGYGEYGRYLWRKGEKEESLECFLKYQGPEKTNEQEQKRTPGLLKWEAEMKEYQKQRAK